HDPNKTYFKRYIPVQYTRWFLVVFILLLLAFYAAVKIDRWVEEIPDAPIPSAAPLTDWSRTKR
ncbi:hypothetical protein PENTCL1PPCAC_10085, partial [Pristionchus entomophagus]